jgi:hypothetical protein
VHSAHVEHRLFIAFARDESEPLLRLDHQSVIAPSAGQFDARNDRIDRGDLGFGHVETRFERTAGSSAALATTSQQALDFWRTPFRWCRSRQS